LKDRERLKLIISNKIYSGLAILVSVVLIATFCYGDKETDVTKPSTILNGIAISTWMYQLQWLDDHSNIEKLDNTDYDMMVVEPGFNFKDDQYDTKYLVSSLKQNPNGKKRILLAYIDIGQAEDYRSYWKSNWLAPTATKRGSPDFLITIDPDGWSGNYPVAYWDPAWQKLWLGTDGLIEKIANYGFDGVYLDWVEAYDDDKVRKFADSKNINTENEMMLFIKKIRNKGKSINPRFLVVSQNAPYLLDANPDLYTSIIDAIATEDTWFYGKGDVPWNDSDAGDLHGGERHADDYSTVNRIAQSKRYLELGIPVFTVDYCISKKKAKQTYIKSQKNGFIPLVTRVPLSQITDTPPF
jgi:cysteinyl-tRNA synthetase